MGEWAILPTFLQQSVFAIRSGLWREAGSSQSSSTELFSARSSAVADENGDPMYFRTAEGVAIMRMSGAMMKPRSKFGGVSTMDQRKNVRAIMSDEKTKAVLMIIDSPGGTVSGTEALAEDIKNLDVMKPVLTYFEDMGASAAYWAGAQARRISANKTAQIGSLGVYGVVVDSSGKAEKEGVVVHVVATGDNKGAFIPGAPITENQLSSYQDLINKINGQFKSAVMQGRKMSSAQVDKLFDGSVWMAEDAKNHGLIDEIESLDSAIQFATTLAQGDGESERLRKMKLSRI